MTAEPSVRDRAAREILNHRTWRGECGCGVTVGDHQPTQAEHIAAALAAAGLLAGEAGLGEHIANRIDREADSDASPKMLALLGGTANKDAFWEGVVVGKRRAAALAREVAR